MNDNQLDDSMDDAANVPDAVQEERVVVVDAGRRSGLSSLQLAAMMGAVGLTPNPFLRDPFEALNGPRTLSYGEAKASLRTTEVDKAKINAAQVKRDRKAAKLKSFK